MRKKYGGKDYFFAVIVTLGCSLFILYPVIHMSKSLLFVVWHHMIAFLYEFSTATEKVFKIIDEVWLLPILCCIASRTGNGRVRIVTSCRMEMEFDLPKLYCRRSIAPPSFWLVLVHYPFLIWWHTVQGKNMYKYELVKTAGNQLVTSGSISQCIYNQYPYIFRKVLANYRVLSFYYFFSEVISFPCGSHGCRHRWMSVHSTKAEKALFGAFHSCLVILGMTSVFYFFPR